MTLNKPGNQSIDKGTIGITHPSKVENYFRTDLNIRIDTALAKFSGLGPISID